MARRGDTYRQELRWRLAYQMNDMVIGQQEAGSNLNTLVDRRRLEMTGSWLGHYIYRLAGGSNGTISEVRVTAYSPGSAMLFAPTLSTAIADGFYYEMHARPVDYYNDALRRAEAYGRQRAHVPVDATLSFVGGQYRYPLYSPAAQLAPFSLDTLHAVYMDSNGAWVKLTGPQESMRPQWRIEPGEQPILVFDPRYFTLPSNGTFQIHGTRRPFLMQFDSDTCEMDEDWVVEEAYLLLRDSAATRGDGEDHLAHSDRALARAERASTLIVPFPPGTIPLRGA